MSQEPSNETRHNRDHERLEKNAERVKQATTRAVDRTHDGLDRAADKVESGIHRGTDRVAGAAASTLDYGSDAAARGREALGDAMDHAGDWTEKGRGYVREKPAQSLVMALAAGWLIGRLMRR